MPSMKTGFAVSCVLLVLILVVTVSSWAEIPKKINYQGRLTDSATGSPLAGSHDMVFRIYDDPGAGSLLWSESQTISADSAGIFSALLGSITPIDIAFSGPVWLEAEAGGETLAPRREIVSVPFAFRADEAEHTLNADSLGGYAADDFVREGETSIITSEMIIDGTGSGLDADMVDGLNADAFADTGHAHDDRYYTQHFLSTPGTLNDSSNPVDWTKLRGVPAGFADGVDDAGGAGDGHSLDAADGDPVNVVFVNNTGNVGVGTLGPGEKIDVDGSVNLSGYLKMDNRTVLSTDGVYNLRLGWGAGPHSTGEYNTFLGCRAGSSNTSGEHNTFVGFDAGLSNTTGHVNTFVGLGAGQANTTGGACTFVGYVAGYENTTADFNTFVGYYAGSENTTGLGNTFMGVTTGRSNIEGRENCFMGSGAGYGNLSGSWNTYLGNEAGYTNTTGDNNVLIGYRAGYNETGSDKLYIANSDAGPPLIYGDFSSGRIGLGTTTPERTLHMAGDNPRILLDAATSNPEINFRNSGDAYTEMWAIYKDGATDDLRLFQSGDKVTFEAATGNVGIGTETPASKLDVAGEVNTSSHYNIGGAPVLRGGEDRNLLIGIDAGASCTGTEVLCVGDSAGFNTEGGWGTFLGIGAGFNNTVWGNTFVGWHAGYSNTTGGSNVFVGRSAGITNTTGSDNTVVGELAGYRNDDGEGNVFVGKTAGHHNSHGSENTFLGGRAGEENLTGDKNTYLGSYAGHFCRGSYNTCVGAQAGKFAMVGSNNVFIGYQAGYNDDASEQLIVANGSADDDVLIYGKFDTGHLGLGTLEPEERLHIAGDNPRILIEAEASNSEINFKNTGDTSTEIWALYKNGANDDLHFYQNSANRLTIKNSTGNIGIGTDSPGSYKLYVNGEAHSTIGWHSSDLRFKEDIEGIESALDKVLNLRGVLFKWKTEEYSDKGFPEGKHYGVIAQEAEEVLPEIVKDGPDGEKSVAYTEIIPVLIESIRELKMENEALRQRIEILEVRRD